MGPNYSIVYKKWVENNVVGALSRRESNELMEGQFTTISSIQLAWLTEVQDNWNHDEWVQQLVAEIIVGLEQIEGYTYSNSILKFQGKLYIGISGDLRSKIIRDMHSIWTDDHSGKKVTLKRVQQFLLAGNVGGCH